MRSVVFVAPFFAATTLRFVQAAAALPGVRLGLVSQEAPERWPVTLRRRLGAYVRLPDALDGGQIAAGVQRCGREIGRCERLLGALEQIQEPLAEVRRAFDIPGMNVEAARNFRDKSQMKDVFRAAGIPCARHALVGSIAEGCRAAESIGFPLVIKPPAGAGARNTARVESLAELNQFLGWSPPRESEPMLLEEFVVGEEHSFDAVSIDGRTIWHSLTHYRPGPLEVMENPWIQWTVLLPREVDHPRYDDIRDVAARALRSLGMKTGLSHMEWFRRGDGSLAVSEVAARPPGAQFTTLISYAHEMDFYEAWARLMIYEDFSPPRRSYAAGIAFLRGQGEGRVRRIVGLEEAQRELGPLVVEASLPRPGQHPAGSYEGEGYVVLRHPETRIVSEALDRLVSSVRVELG